MERTLKSAALLQRMKRLYLDAPEGVTDDEIMALLQVSRATVCRYRARLSAQQVKPGRYTVEPNADDLDYADAVYRRVYGMTVEQLVMKHVRPWHDRWRK